MSVLVVGTRGSRLALRQTQQVVDMLRQVVPGLECSIQVIRTTGDKIQDVPLAKIGDRGLFVKQIELALMRGDIDCAVHSSKDLPSEMNELLTIAAYLEREDPSDALISKVGRFAEMPSGSRVGTSSVRRRAQILAARPDLQVVDLRGNLDTRLRKVDGPGYDAVILASAGLRRMGLESRITQLLPFEICLPAVGQGAIAVQCRTGDGACEFLSKLDDAATRICVTAERAMLRRLGAGCQTPVAALAQVNGEVVTLDALVAAIDGSRIVRESGSGEASGPEELGTRIAEQLLASSAGELLEEVRRSADSKTTGAA